MVACLHLEGCINGPLHLESLFWVPSFKKDKTLLKGFVSLVVQSGVVWSTTNNKNTAVILSKSFWHCGVLLLFSIKSSPISLGYTKILSKSLWLGVSRLLNLNNASQQKLMTLFNLRTIIYILVVSLVSLPVSLDYTKILSKSLWLSVSSFSLIDRILFIGTCYASQQKLWRDTFSWTLNFKGHCSDSQQKFWRGRTFYFISTPRDSQHKLWHVARN